MTTSGAVSLEFSIAQLVEEAFERAGYDVQKLSAWHMETARRSLNYVFADWANKGIKTWAIDEQSFTVAAGDGSYDLVDGTIDVLDAYIRRDGADVMLTRISREDYVALPNKANAGKPDRFWLLRGRATPTMTLWPVPENATDTITYWRIRRLHDVTAAAETADIPHRWADALAGALALRLWGKLPLDQRNPKDRIILEKDAMDSYAAAFTEDRDRAPTMVLPGFWNL